MKTKIKRHSRSVLSVVLALCMLVSCMTAGMIMTDAAKVDSESVGAQTYYYRANYNTWNAVAMTVSADGYYEYVQSSNSSNQFKIAKSADGWDYNYSYVQKEFNSTDVSDIGDYNSDNCYCWQSGTYYILMYYPNTTINNTSKPIICASTFLPDNKPGYYLHYTKNDSGMSGATVLRLTESSTTGVYEGTVSSWNENIMNLNVDTNSSNTTNSTNLTSVAATVGTGITVDQSTPQTHSSYYRAQISLSSNPQDLTFSFNSTTGVLTVTGSGSSSMYIIGDRALGNGIGWTSGDARKEMTESGDDYTYTSVEIPADSVYGFRLTNSSTDWGTNYGSTKLDPVDNDYIKAEAGASDNNIKVTFKLACSITVRYDTSEDKIYVTANPGVKSTLSIASDIAGATVTAAYNGTTINEGKNLANVPAGAQVTITVDPDTAGKVCTKIATTPADIASLSGSTWTLTMPAQDASIDSVTIGNALPKTVYFNNYVSQWSKVYVYTKNASGEEGNGSAPGMEMTQVGTSSIYSAEIPGDTTYIVFSGSGGATNEGSTHITYKTDTNYGNSLPSDYTEYKATAADGSTGEWTAHSDRDNVYTVTPGTSITGNNNLFYNGITATLYDYYTDGEYNNGDAEWITGIQPYDANSRKAEYSVNRGDLFKWNPYKTFNAALSQYANDKNITYPLYFGNLNKANENASEGNLNKIGGSNTADYTNWYYKINNATNLKPNTSSVTGLAANEESNSSINHSSGTAMAMFDEDWLSQENSTGSPLATILHSSAFPVRKVNKSGTMDYVVLNKNNKWDGENIWAWMWEEGKSGKWVKFTKDNDTGFYLAPAADYDKMKIFSLNADPADVNAYGTPNIKNNDNAVTSDITITKADHSIYRLSAYNSGSFTTDSASPAKIIPDYTLYEFDSTDGTDNAYIQNVKTGDHTATMEYSDTTHVYSAGTPSGGTQGFFPFDNMTGDITNQHTSGGSDNPAHDLGFGMKLEIPFSLNPNGTVDSTENGIAQTFNFSGDDDLWVYIDGHLVLDLGGAHKKAEGSIDFKNKTATSTTKVVAASSATDNSISDLTATQTYSNSFASATWFDSSPEALHTMTIYYMERGMYDSNLKFNFSFHAIQNLYTTEKKIRTRDINSGFYIKDATTRDEVTGMTKFEASYQYEHFNVDHKVSSDDTTYANPANEFNYARVEITPTPTGDTKVTHTESHAANADLVYDLTNDDRAQFNGKFTSGDYFQLTETAATSNKYSYTPTLTVYDDTDKSGKTKYNVTPLGDGSFKFRFDEPNTGLRTVNVRGQLENVMKQHDLTITKSIGDKTDTETEFEFQIKFKFAYHKSDGTVNSTYEGYPLYLSSNKDATKTQTYSKSQSHGYFKLKAGETITIPKIPEGAEFEIIETLDNITNYTYGGMTADGATAIPVSGENAVTMTMGTSPVAVTATNNDNTVKATIRVKYAPSYYDFEHNTSNVTQDTYKNGTKFTNRIDCSTEFTDSAKDSTVIGESTMVETAVILIPDRK